MVSIIQIPCTRSFGNIPEEGYNQGWLDQIIKYQIEFITSRLNDPKYGDIFNDIKESVLWTDTQRETTFPVDPVALVMMYGPKGEIYCGHIYIWLQQNGDLLEAHVIGIRKSANLIYGEVNIKVMPTLFDACEKWALSHGAKALRAQDPLPTASKYLESIGYTKTVRWQDLQFKYSHRQFYQESVEPRIIENPEDYYTDYIKYF